MSYKEYIIAKALEKITKRYRLSADEIRHDLEIYLDSFDFTVFSHLTPKQIEKHPNINRMLKSYIKKLYYHKRHYYHTPDQSHISIKEREDVQLIWKEFLKDILQSTKTVLDIGCGEFPRLIPWDDCPDLEKYDAVDRQQKALDHIIQAGLSKVNCILANLSKPWPSSIVSQSYDIGFALQLFPVLIRQHGWGILENWTHLHCPKWIISGAHWSLVRQKNIRRREEQVLEKVAKRLGWTIVHKREIGSESVWICES